MLEYIFKAGEGQRESEPINPLPGLLCGPLQLKLDIHMLLVA